MGEEAPEFIGKYKVQRELGKGATAVVYLCSDPDRTEPVAIKLVSFSADGKDKAKLNRRLLKLFQTEWTVSQKLDHPNIIRIYDRVVEETQAYLVMEYFNGQPLSHYCNIDRLLPVHRSVSIVFKCAMVLDFAYHHGIVHRDIKPANILIDDTFNIKIADFGLGLNVLKRSDTDSTFVTGVGSPAYMSPEQIKGYPLNQQTDIYSLGVVLFHLLTGRMPFRGRSQADLLYKIINADPPSASQLNPDVPKEIDAVIAKVLAKELFARYANGADLAQDLSGVRYQIQEENVQPRDEARFSVLRQQVFFTEFENVELWEVLRISRWRKVAAGALLMREGEADRRFGIIISGEVEVSLEGRLIATLGPGEIVGELAYLDATHGRRTATVTCIAEMVFIEINPQALSLCSEELLERFNNQLIAVVAQRMAAANRKLAATAAPAQKAAEKIDLELVPIDLAEAPRP
jgi:CRP-like cAMP-binding protein/predicted Ser/Thr protein kinase